MWNKSSVMRESVFHAEERKSLFFFWNFWSWSQHTRTHNKRVLPQKKNYSIRQREESQKNLSCVCVCVLFSRGDKTLSRFVSDRLSRRISQISLHLVLSRGSIALFYKEVFIYQNTVISVILLLSMHRRERESRKRKYSLSLLKKENEDYTQSTTAQSKRGRVCDHLVSRENIFP